MAKSLELEEKVKVLENTNQLISKKNQELQTKTKNLEERLDELEQRSRMCNIEIVGVPRTTNEDCIEVVKVVAAVAGIHVEDKDIVIAHRVPSNKHTHRPIIAQLASRSTKLNWIKAFRKKKTITADEVHRTFAKTTVFVNEHLSPHYKYLLKQTKDWAKKNNYKYVWVQDSKILLKQGEGSTAHNIRSIQKLEQLNNKQQHHSDDSVFYSE